MFYFYFLKDPEISKMLSLQEREVKAVEWNTPSKFLKSIQQSEKKVIST